MNLITEEEAEGLMADAVQDALDADEDVPFFPFEPHNVLGIHTHKIGVGDGLWFRTYTEEVYDNRGRPSESNRDLYDTVEN